MTTLFEKINGKAVMLKSFFCSKAVVYQWIDCDSIIGVFKSEK